MKLKLLINGMHCEHCVAAVRGALQAVPGVDGCTVSVGQAEVCYDPRTAGKADLVQAVRQAGPYEIGGFAAA